MRYHLSLGSNLGEREQTLRQAITLIEQQIGPVLRCSSFFYSEPWGFESAHGFCNLCCAVETPLSPMEVLTRTQSIERALGRNHKSPRLCRSSEITNNKPVYSDRTIDIDIIEAFDEQGKEIQLNTPTLTLPHPLWTQRDFVRIPLQEIKKESSKAL